MQDAVLDLRQRLEAERERGTVMTGQLIGHRAL
jgi:hypothetical protein